MRGSFGKRTWRCLDSGGRSWKIGISPGPQRNDETQGKLPQADEPIHPDMRELKYIRTSADLLLLPFCRTSTKQDPASSFLIPCDSPSGFSPAAPHPGILNPHSATPWLSRALSVTLRPPPPPQDSQHPSALTPMPGLRRGERVKEQTRGKLPCRRCLGYAGNPSPPALGHGLHSSAARVAKF